MKSVRLIGLFAFVALGWATTVNASTIGLVNSNVCGGSATIADPVYSNSCSDGNISVAVLMKVGGTGISNDLAPGVLALKVFLHYEVSIASGGILNGPSAGVGMVLSDIVTPTGGTGTGVMTFAWDIHATLEASGVFGSFLSFDGPLESGQSWRFCGPNSTQVFFDPCIATSGSTVSETVTVNIPFTFGTPLSLLWSLRGGVGSSSLSAGNGTTDGTVDAFNTALLQPLIVRDSAGNIVPDALVISTDSGFSYAIAQAPSSAVPEPASMLLVATGLIGAGMRRLRKKNAGRKV